MSSKETLHIELVEKALVDIELVEKEQVSVNLIEKITTPLKVNIIDRELVDINLVDKELVEVILKTIDVIPGLRADLESVIASFVFNEVPTKINDKRFRTNYDFMTGTLLVLFNGLKEKYITIINSNTFELPIDTIVMDTIEVCYVKN